MILFKNVTKTYSDDNIALQGINIKIDAGEFVTIVGQSGAGKSTLLKLLIGEEKPSEGEVYLKDKRVDSVKRKKLPSLRRHIGIVFQDFKLLPQKTLFENIAFGLEVLGKPGNEIRERVNQMVSLVGLFEKKDRFPDQISGGEKQRIAIARALVHEPDILLADEPTGNLDAINSWDIIQMLLKINESLGTTVLLATHNKEIVNTINKRVITLNKGRIARDHVVGQYVI